jgi:hypothetical protein
MSYSWMTFLEEYVAAVLQMERRAKGDYSQDTRLEQFPAFTGSPRKQHKQDGLTPWALFAAWEDAKKPGRASVNRWRSVFLDLEKHFAGRDANSITTEEAHTWAEELVTTKRKAPTVNGVWCNAAKTVFGWGHKTRKLVSNPFVGVAVTQPRKVRTRETDGFTPAETSLILKAALRFNNIPKRTSEAAKRWVPWIIYAAIGVLVCLLLWRVATQWRVRSAEATNLRVSVLIFGVVALVLVVWQAHILNQRMSEGSRIDVRYWRLADILIVLGNVRCRGKVDVTEQPRGFTRHF